MHYMTPINYKRARYFVISTDIEKDFPGLPIPMEDKYRVIDISGKEITGDLANKIMIKADKLLKKDPTFKDEIGRIRGSYHW